jgi:hypothetical protein
MFRPKGELCILFVQHNKMIISELFYLTEEK